MKVVYVPGLSVTKENLQKVKEVLKEGNIEIEPLISDYLSIARMSKQDIERTIMNRLDCIEEANDDTHLLCHSMGCNLGVLASKHPSVGSITFVSPEFRKVTRKEQKEIEQIRKEKYSEEKEESVKRDLQEQLLLVGLFLKSRKWALKELHQVEIPTMVVYSEGDKFVSRKGIKEIGDRFTRKIMLETSFHNPFLSKEGKTLVKKYRNYIGG